MAILTSKSEKRTRRHNRIRAKISGTKEQPRVSVFKSLKYMYAQVIDDTTGTTIASASSKDLKIKKSEASVAVGKELAKLAKAKGVTKVVFDRGGYIYTGRVKTLAETLRAEGLTF